RPSVAGNRLLRECDKSAPDEGLGQRHFVGVLTQRLGLGQGYLGGTGAQRLAGLGPTQGLLRRHGPPGNRRHAAQDEARRLGPPPKSACSWFSPAYAGHDSPPFSQQSKYGCRKYQQRGRCNRFPPSVAMLRNCGVAATAAASASRG